MNNAVLIGKNTRRIFRIGFNYAILDCKFGVAVNADARIDTLEVGIVNARCLSRTFPDNRTCHGSLGGSRCLKRTLIDPGCGVSAARDGVAVLDDGSRILGGVVIDYRGIFCLRDFCRHFHLLGYCLVNCVRGRFPGKICLCFSASAGREYEYQRKKY